MAEKQTGQEQRRRWGFLRDARHRAGSWIPAETLQQWYQEIADNPANGTPTKDPAIFHQYFAGDWAGAKAGFRFWYKSPYTSPRTGDRWNGMIVYVEVVQGRSKLAPGEEKESLALLHKLFDLVTEGIKLGKVIVERIPK